MLLLPLSMALGSIFKLDNRRSSHSFRFRWHCFLLLPISSLSKQILVLTNTDLGPHSWCIFLSPVLWSPSIELSSIHPMDQTSISSTCPSHSFPSPISHSQFLLFYAVEYSISHWLPFVSTSPSCYPRGIVGDGVGHSWRSRIEF